VCHVSSCVVCLCVGWNPCVSRCFLPPHAEWNSHENSHENCCVTVGRRTRRQLRAIAIGTRNYAYLKFEFFCVAPIETRSLSLNNELTISKPRPKLRLHHDAFVHSPPCLVTCSLSDKRLSDSKRPNLGHLICLLSTKNSTPLRFGSTSAFIGNKSETKHPADPATC
jgi:hypothetical protein